ncbi:MAG: TRAP transporter permease [Proteobacteria bacterium]|nr:TRAP transporter permease [Pseudomonadota bacterium]MBU1965679.1 TRAP transporter permease [Pseudomonadota bacterium]
MDSRDGKQNGPVREEPAVQGTAAIQEEEALAAQRAKEVLDEFERKRQYGGLPALLISTTAVLTSCYHLLYAYFHPFFALDHRALHWLFMSVMLFALYPFSKKRSPLTRMSAPDVIFLVVSVGICVWIFIYSTSIMKRAGTYGTMDVVMGTILVLIVLEAARRAAGLAVPLIALVFIGYALFGPYLPDVLAHKGYSIQRLSTYLSLSTDGIFGVPIGVSANFILLFILYGALLRKTGAGQFFTDVAFALTGWTRGGPAKAAVVSSTFFGMISGSSVANTVTTGTFTIPLMKRTGYPAHFAGGVEAASSTMGQIMPPIMGAAAFIMAEFLSVPYYKVCIAAAIPATLAFFSTFMQVHFRAVSLGLSGLPRNELPKIGAAFAAGWHHLFSIFLLIAFLMQDFSPERAVFWAIIATIVTSFIMSLVRKESLKAFVKNILGGLEEGAIGAVEVAAACAAAGIIIGSITMTGLGIKFSSMIVDASMGQLYLALPFTMIACLFLGMGVPTTAQYVIISALVAPALVQMGVLPMAAHLFILYFGTRADITPPVALAAYAAAGIARSDPWKTGLAAFQLGIAGFIIPFMFIYAPELLFVGSAWRIIPALLTAAFGVLCLAAAVQRCLLVITRWYEAALLLVTALLLIKPGIQTDLIGAALFLVVFLLQWFRRKRERGPASSA